MINICISSDENYAKYAGVLIASILYNAEPDDELCFYILDGGINNTTKEEILKLKNIKDCIINFVEIDDNIFADYSNIKTHSYIPLSTYYRLKLSSLLTNIDKIIYLDCDIIVNSSLKDLFNVYLEENPIAGVLDINKRMLQKNPSYVNAGMLLMDLKKIREENIEESFLHWTKEHLNTIQMGDQEIINEVLKGRIKILDEKWNVQSSNFTNRSSYTNTPYIIHFVSKRKPWHFGSFSYHRKYYFKYLQLTPWALTDDEKWYWYIWNQIVSLYRYFLYRPLFIFRPRFYKALFFTYIKPLLKG